MTDADRERTAYHESGHALVGMLTPGADPVRKISIIPRGQALGVTLSTPEGDRYGLRPRGPASAQIKVALGGRAAEKVVYGEHHHRRRVRHPEPHADRPRDGRPLGMSDAIGPIAVADGAPGRAAAARRGRRASPPTPASWSTRRCGGSSRRPSTTWSTLLERERRAPRGARPRAARAGDARPGRGLRGRRRAAARVGGRSARPGVVVAREVEVLVAASPATT